MLAIGWAMLGAERACQRYSPGLTFKQGWAADPRAYSCASESSENRITTSIVTDLRSPPGASVGAGRGGVVSVGSVGWLVGAAEGSVGAPEALAEPLPSALNCSLWLEAAVTSSIDTTAAARRRGGRAERRDDVKNKGLLLTKRARPRAPAEQALLATADSVHLATDRVLAEAW